MNPKAEKDLFFVDESYILISAPVPKTLKQSDLYLMAYILLVRCEAFLSFI